MAAASFLSTYSARDYCRNVSPINLPVRYLFAPLEAAPIGDGRFGANRWFEQWAGWSIALRLILKLRMSTVDMRHQ